MKKYFVSSDIHSYFNEWMKALKKAKFNIDNKNHIIVVCGDLLDRGPDARKCLSFVVKLLKEGRAICIKGNHECLLEDIFKKGYFEHFDEHNGTMDTVLQLSNIYPDTSDSIFQIMANAIKTCKEDRDLKYYLHNCKYYYDLDEYIFVHGWLPCAFETENELEYYYNIGKYSINDDYHSTPDYYWEKIGVWTNGMKAWKDGAIIKDKTIVCGHWNTSFGHTFYHNDGYCNFKDVLYNMTDEEVLKLQSINKIKNKDKNKYNQAMKKLFRKYINVTPFIDEGIIALDASTHSSGIVNCYVIKK